MRYNDWDVLLFPADSTIPMKEFRVDCHLVHDIEFSSSNGSTGLPTMTCFVPCLDAGIPFQISIHSWGGRPEVSQFTKSFSKHTELVQFEARVFIDGCFVASAILDPMGTWPCQIYNTFDFTKNGDLDTLRFPLFQYDILQQRGWSPADDLGRIRLVISEGFPRGSVTVPVERVKNIAAFSFQYAPLSILEGAGLAWPRPSLWLHSPVPSSKPVPTYAPDDGALLHSHSPRRSKHKRAAAKERELGSNLPSHRDYRGNRAESGPSAISRRKLMSPHSAQAGRHRTYRTPPPSLNWMGQDSRNEKSSYYTQMPGKVPMGQQNSASDTSMPDYFGFPQDGHGSWSYFNPKGYSDDFMESCSSGNRPVALSKAPANTPASTSTDDSSTPGKGNPFQLRNTHKNRARVSPAGFVDMAQRSHIGQPSHTCTPTSARNVPLPPSLPGSAAGSQACPHVHEGELMCSDPFCHCNTLTAMGTYKSKDSLGGKQQYSQPYGGTGMEGGSGSLIRLETGRSVGSHSGSGSNDAKNGGTDVAMKRLSLDSANVAPTQGLGQTPGSKGLSSGTGGSGGLTDEVLMQALAQA